STVAGLAAINGPRHGGLTREVARLFDELRGATDLEAALAGEVRDGRLPGFGHPLYPGGDVRASALLGSLRGVLPRSPELVFAERLAATAEGLGVRRANLDFATVTIERVLGLPKDSALALFVVGRTVGWIAHALEQAAQGSLIRPRARYTGPPPGGLV